MVADHQGGRHQGGIGRSSSYPAAKNQSADDKIRATPQSSRSAVWAGAPRLLRSEARATRGAPGSGAGAARGGPRLHRQQALALHALAGELARPADRFRLLARLLFRGFFVVAAELHLAENALALHLLFQRLEGLVDVIVADENLHASFLLLWSARIVDVQEPADLPPKRDRAGSDWRRMWQNQPKESTASGENPPGWAPGGILVG